MQRILIVIDSPSPTLITDCKSHLYTSIGVAFQFAACNSNFDALKSAPL
jgi:hypothetical protein